MLISDSHEFIYLRMRKVASTSMRDILRPLCIPIPEGKLAHLKSRARLEWDYHHYVFRSHDDILSAKKRMPQELFTRYFKFAFVRNPWDRMVSRYWYLRGYHENDPDQKINDRGYYPPGKLSFVDWLMGNNRNCVNSLDLRQQKDWITNESGRIVIDYIGKYENIEHDFNELCKIIGVKVSLPKLNSAKKGKYRNYYNQVAIDFVYDRFKDDISTWGYQF